jgi:ribosomal protein L21E
MMRCRELRKRKRERRSALGRPLRTYDPGDVLHMVSRRAYAPHAHVHKYPAC